jgi:hypothetical protein
VGTTVTSREVKSWTRFVIRHLGAQPDIMGREHRFAFDGNMITIKLPRLEHVDRGEGYDEIASVRVRSADGKPRDYGPTARKLRYHLIDSICLSAKGLHQYYQVRLIRETSRQIHL